MGDDENEIIQTAYFIKKNHSCMVEFLIQQFDDNNLSRGLLLQILTYGPLMSKLAIHNMMKSLNIDDENCKYFNLHQFDTEMDFCNALR